MTSNQIKLREVKELERHNRATETLTGESNVITREHYERADRASLIQAYASQTQAAAAMRNAAVNEINASTNRYNAETNRMAAEAQISYNSGMLEVARQNAESQSVQAAAAQTNAQTNQAKQSLEESKFEWNKYLDEQQLLIDQYTANLQGLKFKEDVYEYRDQAKDRASQRNLNRAKSFQSWTGGINNLTKSASDIYKMFNPVTSQKFTTNNYYNGVIE